jgi:O-antigen/teichoic acid export membrane protein
MTFRRNLLSNYAGQLYVAFVGIAMIPLYLRYMGAEAYGLVGFFTMMQAWFLLLDVGLTPTLSRAASSYAGGSIDALTLRRVLRILEGVFLAVGLTAASLISYGASYISGEWLQVASLDKMQVETAIRLMAIIALLRWATGLYRGVLAGFEKLVWLNALNVLVATFRFALVIPYMVLFGADPVQFFSYQVVVSLVEFGFLSLKAYRLLPQVDDARNAGWNWAPIRGVLKISLTIALTSSIWIAVTQTDKLILSGLIPLTDYAFFALAVSVAGGINIVSAPVSGALLPRLTRLNAEGKHVELLQLYRRASQLVVGVVGPVALFLFFFGEHAIWAWTGDRETAHRTAETLGLYAIGNGLLALAAFPYYLQFAKGDLRLHLIGNLLFAAIYLPILYYLVLRAGVTGAGYAWILANALPLLLWTPVVHRRFMPTAHMRWLILDLLPVLAVPALIVVGLNLLVDWTGDRWSVVIKGLCVLILQWSGAVLAIFVTHRFRRLPMAIRID